MEKKKSFPTNVKILAQLALCKQHSFMYVFHIFQNTHLIFAIDKTLDLLFWQNKIKN